MRYAVSDRCGHKCCNECSVVDTAKPVLFGDEAYMDRDGNAVYEEVCECADYDIAQMIADALNARVEQ